MDKTEVRDAIREAVDLASSILAERNARGVMVSTTDDAYRLFYHAMVELAGVNEGGRTALLRSLLANAELGAKI